MNFKSLKKNLKVPSMKKLQSFCKRKEVLLAVGLLVAYVAFTMYKRHMVVEGFQSTPSSFESDVSGGKKLVWFYADWCGHCKKMKSGWDTASDKFKDVMVKIDLGDSKDAEQQKISKKYNIDGFPTILLLDNGEIEKTYEGGRNAKDFETFCSNLKK